MKKKILYFAVISVFVLTSVACAYAAEINVNGSQVAFTDQTGRPFVDENSRTQVPLRVTMEQAGATVGWDASTKTATVVKRGTTVQVPIGVDYIIVDGKKVQNDTVAVIKDGRTYLPIRAVLEALDFRVEWDSGSQTVIAANFADYVEIQQNMVDEAGRNIKTAEDLLNYYRDSIALKENQEIVTKLAEKEVMDRIASTPIKFKVKEWCTFLDLRDHYHLDEKNFNVELDRNKGKSTFSGYIEIRNYGKAVKTIHIPEFSLVVADTPEEGVIYEFDGMTIKFYPTKTNDFELLFKGEELEALGIIIR